MVIFVRLAWSVPGSVPKIIISHCIGVGQQGIPAKHTTDVPMDSQWRKHTQDFPPPVSIHRVIGTEFLKYPRGVGLRPFSIVPVSFPRIGVLKGFINFEVI